MKTYIVIDLKSFYASVECVELGLDPFKTNLVVADTSRGDGTVCLAVTPYMKAQGVKNRCRLYEIPKNIKYTTVAPRMQYYIDYAAKIYGIYLKYIAKEDIYVYSIDEAFMDISEYIKFYSLDARSLAKMIMEDIFKTTGITAACGIGTNLYLAKISLDMLAKHSDDNIAFLDENLYKEKLWTHRPLSDFWRIGKQTEAKLNRYGIFCMKDMSMVPLNLLEKIFGIDAYIALDHANGIEPTTIADIKAYKPSTRSFYSSEILPRDYEYYEALTVIKEMSDRLSLKMLAQNVKASGISIVIKFADKNLGHERATISYPTPTNITSKIIQSVEDLYLNKIKNLGLIRQISISANNIKKDTQVEKSLFDEQDDKEKTALKAINAIKDKFGKNAILRAIDLMPEATGRDRNEKIGGHKSGVKDKK
ncbi:DNA repair protein [Campylobacter sp. RM12920]|uniref:DNA repair protein n=1 Tax=Campylobacter californiensis TaxID=1032243 RepID=A0ABD4JH73_9BACT|nr:DNA repair protein [Campylobacter sp. RM12919]MBE2988148.1 DNA repair protein [Campylobacter sp. RM12920]